MSALQPEDVDASRRRVTRVLFAAMVFVVPAPFFWLFVIWLVPLACASATVLRLLVVAPFSGEVGGAIVVAIILAAHIAFDGGLLYVGAVLVSRVLFWPRSPRFAQFGVVVLVALGIVASTFPIYGFPSMGDGNPEMMNVSGVYRLFVTGQPPKSRRRVGYPR